MAKKYRIFGLTIVLICITLNLSGCSVISTIKSKITGTTTNYFSDYTTSTVDEIVFQSTRNTSFKIDLTESSMIKTVCSALSSAKQSSTTSSLDADYIIKFKVGDEWQTYYYVVGSEKGNFYTEDGSASYTVSKRLDDCFSTYLTSLRKPRDFDSVYYNAMLEVLEKVADEVDDSYTVGVDISGDKDCLQYVFSTYIESFLISAEDIMQSVSMVNDDADSYDVVLTVTNRGYDTTTYKTSVEVTYTNSDGDSVDETYYVVAEYENKAWDITVSEADEEPSDW